MPKRPARYGYIAAVNLALIAGMIAGTELIFGFLNHLRDGPWRKAPLLVSSESEGYKQPDPVLGYRVSPNFVARKRATLGDETLFDVTHSTNRYGWRVTPLPPGGAPCPSFAAFFGGSFAAGHGVENGETLPARFQHHAGRFRAYNFAVGGWGPQHMLAILESEEIELGIAEEGGIAIFVFSNWHLRRLAGAYSVFFSRRFPYYALSTDGKVEHRGNFADDRPLLDLVFGILDQSETAHFVGRQKFDFLTPPDIALLAALFKKACENFERRYESMGCYVLFYPHGQGSVNMARRVIPALEKAGVSYIDYSGMFSEAQKAEQIFRVEKYPKASAYELIAQRLAADIARRTGQ